MRKLKIYLDTSVISFYFSQDSIEFKNITIDFFEQCASNYDIYISDIVILEINKNTNLELKEKMLELLNSYGIKKLETKEEIKNISRIYLESGIIPKNKVEDALHVAFTTYYEMDILLSWNFKHLANVHKEQKIMIENTKMGYLHALRLLSPLEVIDDTE